MANKARALFRGKVCSCTRTVIWTYMYRLSGRSVLTWKFTWSGGSKRCCLSFQLPRSLEDKQVTIILGTTVNKYYVLFQFWKWRSIKQNRSICSCSGIHMVNAKTVFLMKCCSLWPWLHQMYFQGKAAERSLKTLNNAEKRNKTADFVEIILHVCKRKDINGCRFKTIANFCFKQIFRMSANIL